MVRLQFRKKIIGTFCRQTKKKIHVLEKAENFRILVKHCKLWKRPFTKAKILISYIKEFARHIVYESTCITFYQFVEASKSVVSHIRDV